MLRITLSIDQLQTNIKDKVFEAFKNRIISREAQAEDLKCFVCKTDSVQELLKIDEGVLSKEREKMRQNMDKMIQGMDEVK